MLQPLRCLGRVLGMSVRAVPVVRARMVEDLESRRLMSFTFWSSIGPAIAKVPTSAGAITSTSVIDFGTTVYTGPLNVKNTLDRIRANNGPDRSNDGSVFNNGGELPSGHGTWYEFTVEPSGGTDRNFSGITFPGPMRILMATDGDTFFTGDHYVIFQQVYDPAVNGTPTIGSFAVNPTSVVTGGSVTLTAGNVSETGGTISSVKFYRETNGTTGFQAGDTLVASGTPSGTTWSASVATTGLAAGSYTYYAVATDAAAVSSGAAAALLSVTSSVTGGELLGWNVAGQTGFGAQGLLAGSVAVGVTDSLGLTRASGLQLSSSPASNAWGANNWASNSAAGISGSQYLTFGLTVGSGYTASLSAIDVNYRRSSTGPSSGYWQYQLNGGAWTVVSDVANEFPSTSSSGAAMAELNLSGVSGLTAVPAGSAVNFRLIPYGATTTGGTWYVYDLAGNDLVVKGTVSAVATLPNWLAAGSAATWSASTHALNLTGTATIIADPGLDAPLVTASGVGSVLRVAPPTDRVIQLGGLMLSGGATADILSVGAGRTQANHVVVRLPGTGLTVDGASKVDVEDNDLIVTSVSALAATGALSLVNGLAASGQNATALFGGNGITSSVAGTEALSGLRYALGVVQNKLGGATLYDTFDGVSVGLNDVLVKFTYFGDADLSGTVDDTDYFLINSGFTSGLTGWLNGDFDYSGTVDDADYFLLNNAFTTQGAVL